MIWKKLCWGWDIIECNTWGSRGGSAIVDGKILLNVAVLN